MRVPGVPIAPEMPLPVRTLSLLQLKGQVHRVSLHIQPALAAEIPGIRLEEDEANLEAALDEENNCWET